MTHSTQKMSEIMQEMVERLLRLPAQPPSSEAAHVALFFATAAWNESVGLANARNGYRHVWEQIESDNPTLWNELKSNDVNQMIDDLVRHKQTHYADDRRRILMCGIVNSKIRVEWLPPAAPGVDAKWETNLYGLVRTGDRPGAIRFLQGTRRISRAAAAKRVAKIAADLGMA
jgi:hypothetical protein